MKQGRLFVIGAALFSIGIIGCSYFVVLIIGARLNGVFSALVTDAPNQAFPTFQCPYFMDIGETASVGPTILNSSWEPLSYSIQITTDGFRLDTAASVQSLSVPGQQSAHLSWEITALDSGQRIIEVVAISSKDAALPKTLHQWPTSYREGCGIYVFAGPVKGWQIPVGGLMSGVLGSMLAFPSGYARLRAWRARQQRVSDRS